MKKLNEFAETASVRGGFVLAAMAAYALVRNIAGSCSACQTDSIADYAIPIIGIIFYTLWGLGCLSLLERAVGVLLHFALLLTLKASCGLCGVIFISSALLVLAATGAKYGWRAGFAAVLVVVFMAAQLPVGAPRIQIKPSRRPQILAYIKDGCQYCEQFTTSYVPDLKKKFDVYLESADIPQAVSSFPTIIVMPASGAKPTVFEGLPPLADILKAAGQ